MESMYWEWHYVGGYSQFDGFGVIYHKVLVNYQREMFFSLN